jgi:RimJ/RimL family protein N-acetyltransferase
MLDFPDICRIYAGAREFMREKGNPNQWKDGFPAPALIASDIKAGHSYVCICNGDSDGYGDGAVAAVFYYHIEDEPIYRIIDGHWLNNEPYGIVHRIASSRSFSGAGAFCLNWSFEQCLNLRIDTHRDNTPMRNLLKKLGFTYCGIVWLEDGDERLAFQRV